MQTAPFDGFEPRNLWYEGSFVFLGTLFISMTRAGHIEGQPSWLVWFIALGTIESGITLARSIIWRLDGRPETDENER